MVGLGRLQGLKPGGGTRHCGREKTHGALARRDVTRLRAQMAEHDKRARRHAVSRGCRVVVPRLGPVDKLLAFPRILDNGALLFFSGTVFEAGAHGVSEPVGGTAAPPPDLVIVPGLAFDRAGVRLGRGKGYYDRWLEANPAVRTLGVCFKFQVLERIPAEPHDVCVNAILTEDGFIWP